MLKKAAISFFLGFIALVLLLALVIATRPDTFKVSRDIVVNAPPHQAFAVVNFFVSWLWYSPVLFAKPWMLALGKDPAKMGPEHMTEAEKKMMPLLMLNGFVSSFVKVWALAVLIQGLDIQDAATGISLGLLAWLGFTLTGSLDTLWEGRAPKVLMINNGLFILGYAAFGAILAVWR